ncbi:MAG TPA: M6 family metalloprotease domain-containing protein [Candidatus Sulfomarinibacteraceae bacterium]|nr:M6 family metalloprotease domain-containing protein [Candidatus Sulfomarinibacteraceae bacterium]
MPRRRTPLVACTLLTLGATAALALEPPTREQVERYRLDGTFAAREAAARAIGNHRPAPQLASRVHPGIAVKALPDAPTLLPSSGTTRVLTLLIAFADMPGHTDPEAVDGMLYGDGDPALYPYESLAGFYRRASYGALEITGSTLGWYTTDYPREDVYETAVGRELLIREAIEHWDAEGHDFAQYDNDGDGVIDYFVVIWTGPHGEWAEFWWGYQTRFRNTAYTVDGVRLGTYSWQWESYDWPGPFSPDVVIHETGHALGLPDYYDYDDSVGPRGGVGGMDQMDGNWGDHNAFSKWMLGWLDPDVVNEGADGIILSPTDEWPRAVVFMHGDPVADPFAEYFLAQLRRPVGNDAELPNQGVLIWHVDARLDDDGNLLYDNSYTEHKLLRLMEADGLEEIESGGRADADDFYTSSDVFSTESVPSSHRYDGVPTNVGLLGFSLSWAGPDWMVTYDLGSGCALWCDASVTATAWPGIPVVFSGSLDTANCDGTPSYGWDFGDGGSGGDTTTSHAYTSVGTYSWSVSATLADATCGHQGPIVVCTGLPCWQWTEGPAMAEARGEPAVAVLADGSVLAVGGDTQTAEILDPWTSTWSGAAEPPAVFRGATATVLGDGRVLVAGGTFSNPFPPVNSAVYDPATDTWEVAGQLPNNRWDHSAVAIDDGRALVAGGRWGDWPTVNDATAVLVFDPADGAWTEVGSLSRRLIEPGLVKLADGRVLIVGGREVTAFDPVAGTLTRAAPLPDDWQRPVAVGLADGRVLLADAEGNGLTLLWTPATGRWQLAGSMRLGRSGHTATVLGNGVVVVAGGRDASGIPIGTVELFDPAAAAWSFGSSLARARWDHAAAVVPDGSLLAIGGFVETPTWYEPSRDVEALARPASPPRRPTGRGRP